MGTFGENSGGNVPNSDGCLTITGKSDRFRLSIFDVSEALSIKKGEVF